MCEENRQNVQISKDVKCVREISDYAELQEVLRYEVAKSPNHDTLTNLGMFYVDKGVYSKYGKRISALRHGMNYLEKARKLSRSYRNDLGFGCAYYKQGEFERAVKKFKAADKREHSFAAKYNCALSYIGNRRYEDAVYMLDDAYHEEYGKKSELRYYKPYIYALCNHDPARAADLLNQLPPEVIAEDERDIFALSYYCKNRTLCWKMQKNMTFTGMGDLPTLAMIADIYIRSGETKNGMDYFSRKVWRIYGFDISMMPFIDMTTRQFGDTEYRKRLIARQSFDFEPYVGEKYISLVNENSDGTVYKIRTKK